jgi:hypothetical protein
LKKSFHDLSEPRLQPTYHLQVETRERGYLSSALFLAESYPSCIRSLAGTKVLSTDAAQDALMILATMNWKPKSVPEYLPILHYQTVAQIRNKTLEAIERNGGVMFRHQQTVDDFEVSRL